MGPMGHSPTTSLGLQQHRRSRAPSQSPFLLLLLAKCKFPSLFLLAFEVTDEMAAEWSRMQGETNVSTWTMWEGHHCSRCKLRTSLSLSSLLSHSLHAVGKPSQIQTENHPQMKKSSNSGQDFPYSLQSKIWVF